MRISLGKLVRRYVYGVRLGEQRVTAIYHGDKLIWPTLSDTVYSAVLDVASIEDTLQGSQFRHALEAVQKLGAAADCYILMNAGGREYMLARGFGRYDVAAWDGHATAVFGDNGPLSEALKAGDEVTLKLVVPETRTKMVASPGENTGFSETWETRWLPGTYVVYSHNKGQKKVCAYAFGYVTGHPSGKKYIEMPLHWHTGDDRALFVHLHQPDKNLVPSYADTLFKVSMQVGGSSAVYGCYLQFPKFTATIKLKVSAVTLHK